MTDARRAKAPGGVAQGERPIRRAPAELATFLAAYDSRVGKLFRAARKAVLEAAPDANELLYDVYNGVSAVYSFSDRTQEAFIHVVAYPAHVNLGFNRGTELPDPAAILEGSGAKIRHVRIDAAGDLARAQVRALIEAAVEQGAARVAARPPTPRSWVHSVSAKKRRP